MKTNSFKKCFLSLLSLMIVIILLESNVVANVFNPWDNPDIEKNPSAREYYGNFYTIIGGWTEVKLGRFKYIIECSHIPDDPDFDVHHDYYAIKVKLVITPSIADPHYTDHYVGCIDWFWTDIETNHNQCVIVEDPEAFHPHETVGSSNSGITWGSTVTTSSSGISFSVTNTQSFPNVDISPYTSDFYIGWDCDVIDYSQDAAKQKTFIATTILKVFNGQPLDCKIRMKTGWYISSRDDISDDYGHHDREVEENIFYSDPTPPSGGGGGLPGDPRVL